MEVINVINLFYWICDHETITMFVPMSTFNQFALIWVFPTIIERVIKIKTHIPVLGKN
jgi:hypothetical protein